MTDIATISVEITADTRALDAALARIQRQAGGIKPVTVPTDTRGLAAAEAATLRFAQARSRLAAQGGDLAGAERIISDALRGTTASTVQTVNAQTKLLAIQQKIAAQGQGGGGLAQTLTNLAGTGSKIEGLIGTVGTLGAALGGVGVAFAAVGAASAAVDFARIGGGIDAARQSFDNLAKSAGTSGDALLSALQRTAAGTVANTDLIKSSNTALLLLGSDVATKLPQLLAVAKASAQTLGTDVGDVFDSLVTGIARGSTELIDNAGIVVKAGEAYATYAAEIGTSADALSAAQKQQAILNAVLTSGQTIIEQTAGGGEAAGAAFQRMDASLANLTASAQVAAANIGAPLAGAFAQAAQGADIFIRAATGQSTAISQSAAAVAATAPSYEAYRAQLAAINGVTETQIASQAGLLAALNGFSPGIAGVTAALLRMTTQTDALSAAQLTYAQNLVAQGSSQEQAVAAAEAQAGALQTIQAALEGSGGALLTYADQALSVAASSAESAVAVENLSKAYLAGTIGPEQYALTLGALEGTLMRQAGASAEAQAALMGYDDATRAATNSVVDAEAAANADIIAKLEQAAAAENVAFKHEQLAAAIELAAGSSGSAEAAAARIAGQFNGVEAPAVLNLINLHRQLAAARAGGAAPAVVAARARGRDGGLSDQRDARANAERAQMARQAAYQTELQNQITRATGSTADQLALVNAELARAPKLSQQALRLEVEKARLLERQTAEAERAAKAGAKGGKGGGAGGAGGAKTETAKAGEAQQREQAALYDKLRDLQERHQDQAVQAERTYQERVLSITQDFAKRRAEAEASFADAQVDSRADFYTSLANVDKGQRTAMIQEFEAAQVKAAEIAATSGADAGEAYLSEITGIIRARAQRQADIAKALEAGDKAEAEFLRGVDAIARAAEQRKLDAAASGGEGLAGQEQAALADAAATRDESLAKAQLQAQQGLVDAEQARADKAKITNEQLQTQLDLVRQIAQAGGVLQGAAPAAATPAAATATPAAGATPGAAPTDGAGLVLSSAPSVENLLNQAIGELRRLRSSPNYAPGA